MSQIVKPHVIKFCGLSDAVPGVLKFPERRAALAPADNPRATLFRCEPVQNFHRRSVQVNILRAGLAFRKAEPCPLKIYVPPLQIEYFAQASAR